MEKVGLRKWISFIVIGLAGQFAWCIENMYLNKFIFYLDSSGNYMQLISITVALSATTAALTTIFIGSLIDKIGHRKLIIIIGYILRGISTISFGFINVENISYLFPTLNAGLVCGVSVILLDCIMTFFGSSANDACFNSYVTREITNKNRGKVEGVLSILPLFAMLVIFVGLNGLTDGENPRWDIFFYIIGAIVLVVGIASIFLLPKEENKKQEDNYLKIITTGFSLKTIKENKTLYLVFLAYMVYGISSQIYFPYLMIYFEYGLGFSGFDFSLVLGIVLIVGSILSVLYGILSDKINKLVSLIPVIIIYSIGLLLLFFVKSGQLVFAIISGIFMMFGYISLSSVLNSIVRNLIPREKEGIFMGIRMLFVVMIPMCTGPFIGEAISSTLPGGTYVDLGVSKPLPSSYIWLVALGVLILILIPIIIIFYLNKKNNDKNKNNGLLREKVDVNFDEVPLKEYPRISLIRDSYISLNGKWDILINKSKEIPTNFDSYCLVPYPIESPLSGVNHLLETDEYIHYHRFIKIPKDFNKGRVVINFEGIDCISTIYLNKREVRKHVGGYTSFSVDITPFIINDQVELDILVCDQTSNSPFAKGKQSLNRGGIWYTSTSGIYKPIWLESTPKIFIKKVDIKPLFDENKVIFNVKTNVDSNCLIEFLNYKINGETNKDVVVDVKNLPVWDLENPNIIDVKVKVNKDEVNTYFGFRKVSIDSYNNKPYIFLNNKPIFINGLLDQGYYQNNLTPKSYEDYLNDIDNIKNLGFNTLRVHIKNELDMFYYYCDTNGILVIQDIPNGGDKYSFWTMLRGGLFPFIKKKNDHNYKAFSRNGEEGRKEYFEILNKTMSNLSNHPSIIMYTLFNEGWGQFDSKEVYEYAKGIDNSKIFDVASGWYDNGFNEIESIHNYFFPLKIKKNLQKPVIFTEFGGYSYIENEHFYGTKVFGYRVFKSKDKLNKVYKKLYSKIYKLKLKGLAGVIYTQLNDVEDETNGLYTLDREILKIDSEVIKEINSKLKI